MTAVAEPAVIIDQPGVHTIPDDVYHADPVPQRSLSASGAKKLLPPSCPAIFDYERRHPPKPKPEFDFGHAAHMKVLGAGAEIVVVEADDWRTADAKAQRAAAHEEGKTPLLRADFERVKAMAAKIREHPIASALFNPAYGKPEQSLFWQDEQSGIQCRARLDWLPTPLSRRRLIIADYKTAVSASLDAIARAVHNYRYHLSAAWYLDGIRALGIADDPAFVFVVQEKSAPYLVTCVQLDDVAERIGRDLGRQAIDIYTRCAEANHWPGYSDDIELISLPAWAEKAHDNP